MPHEAASRVVETSGRVALQAVEVDALTTSATVARVMDSLSAGRGGWIAPVNLDVLRQAARDPGLRDLLSQATVTLPDGAPLLWAAWLAGTPLPGRVAGSDLIFALSGAAAGQGRSVYLLGGAENVPQRAASRLSARFDGLRVAGAYSPPVGFDQSAHGLAEVRRRLRAAEPDLVFVGLGFPKQEKLIVQLRRDLPRTWFLACGAAIPFAAGDLVRAPVWMQRAGLEWVHRLASEPRRLAYRYLVQDVPYAARLLSNSVRSRQGIGRFGRVLPTIVPAPAPVASSSVSEIELNRPASVIDLRELSPSTHPVETDVTAVAERGIR